MAADEPGRDGAHRGVANLKEALALRTFGGLTCSAPIDVVQTTVFQTWTRQSSRRRRASAGSSATRRRASWSAAATAPAVGTRPISPTPLMP